MSIVRRAGKIGGKVEIKANNTFSPLQIDAAALAVLAIGTAGFFWRVIFGRGWMPRGGGDLAPFIYPNYRFAADALKSGVFPLWNPHLYCGSPFAADIQSGLFYPLNLAMFYLLPQITYRSLEYAAIFHFWLAGAGMYLLLRHSRASLSPVAALGGALVFEFCDFFVVHFGNLNMIAAAAWLPIAFLLLHGAIEKRSARRAGVSGVVLAVATLAGHIQVTLFMLIALGLYALWEALAPGWRHASARPLLYLLLAFAVMVGLSALLLIPAYEMARHTPRASLGYEQASQYSLHPVQLIGLLVPNYFGRDPALHWGPWERVETGYVGVLTLLLAFFALVLGGTGTGRRMVHFFGVLGGVALLLALGDSSILHGWLYYLVPGFGQLRAPARFVFLLDFALAALAAFGVEALMREEEATGTAYARLLRYTSYAVGGLVVVGLPLAYYATLVTQDRNPEIFNRAASAASGAATFAFFAIVALVLLHLRRAGRLRGAHFGAAAAALIALDLFSLGAYVDVGEDDPTAGFLHPGAVDFLQKEAGLSRVEVATDVWHVWQPNLSLVEGLYDAWGLYNPLTLAPMTYYWYHVGERSGGLYNLLGVKYMVGGKEGPPADGDFVPVFDADPSVNVYLNRLALPRAVLVGRSVVVGSHDGARLYMENPQNGFDPTAVVVLEEGAGAVEIDAAPEHTSLSFDRYGLNEVVISAAADEEAYLLLSDAYYPGWQAELDGSRVPLLRADYAFRAVYLPPGSHVVRMRFSPGTFRAGLLISSVTALALVAALGLGFRFGADSGRGVT